MRNTTTPRNGIGYTIANEQYRLMALPGERKVDGRSWDLTDADEQAAQQAARELARLRKVAYLGFAK